MLENKGPSMTKSSLMRLIVRFTGVLIVYHLIFSFLQWFTLHWSADARYTAWLPFLLFSFWLLVAVIFLRASDSLIALIESEWGHDGRVFFNRSRGLEFVAIRMLGLYFVMLAFSEIAHLIAFQMEFREKLVHFYRWVEVPRDPTAVLSATATASKLLIGLWLIVGTRRVQSWMRWLRRAGRNWKIE